MPPPDTLERSREIQPRSSFTGHEQCEPPPTDNDDDPAPLPNDNDPGVTVGDDGHVTPLCVTDTLRLPTVTVPVRWPPEFVVTVTRTVPPPDTLERSREIQPRLSFTDHEQCEPPPTDNDRDSVPLPNDNDPGVTEGDGGHDVPACVTDTLRPPIVTVPVRCPPLFVVTVTRTVPPPDTLERSREIQPRSSPTEYVQCEPPPTRNDDDPVPLPNDNDPGVTDGVDGHVSPACVTGTLRPPIVTVPVRGPLSFRFTVIVTVPPPDTLERFREIQLRLSSVAHEHSDGPFARTDARPPSALTVTDGGVTLSGESPQMGPF